MASPAPNRAAHRNLTDSGRPAHSICQLLHASGSGCLGTPARRGKATKPETNSLEWPARSACMGSSAGWAEPLDPMGRQSRRTAHGQEHTALRSSTPSDAATGGAGRMLPALQGGARRPAERRRTHCAEGPEASLRANQNRGKASGYLACWYSFCAISKISSGWYSGVNASAAPSSLARSPPSGGPSTTSRGPLPSSAWPRQTAATSL